MQTGAQVLQVYPHQLYGIQEVLFVGLLVFRYVPEEHAHVLLKHSHEGTGGGPNLGKAGPLKITEVVLGKLPHIWKKKLDIVKKCYAFTV